MWWKESEQCDRLFDWFELSLPVISCWKSEWVWRTLRREFAFPVNSWVLGGGLELVTQIEAVWWGAGNSYCQTPGFMGTGRNWIMFLVTQKRQQVKDNSDLTTKNIKYGSLYFNITSAFTIDYMGGRNKEMFSTDSLQKLFCHCSIYQVS